MPLSRLLFAPSCCDPFVYLFSFEFCFLFVSTFGSWRNVVTGKRRLFVTGIRLKSAITLLPKWPVPKLIQRNWSWKAISENELGDMRLSLTGVHFLDSHSFLFRESNQLLVFFWRFLFFLNVTRNRETEFDLASVLSPLMLKMSSWESRKKDEKHLIIRVMMNILYDTIIVWDIQHGWHPSQEFQSSPAHTEACNSLGFVAVATIAPFRLFVIIIIQLRTHMTCLIFVSPQISPY